MENIAVQELLLGLGVKGKEVRKERESGVVFFRGFMGQSLTMAFIVGLRFTAGLLAMLIVSGSRSIVMVMAALFCMIRWGLSMTLIHSLGTRSGPVEPLRYVALAVSMCILIIV